jgi:hypothetical protein
MEEHRIIKRKEMIAARAAGAQARSEKQDLDPGASTDPKGLQPAPEEEEGVRLMEQAAERANMARRARAR